MARFYNPRRGQEDQPVDYPVGYRGRSQYDPRVDAGSSGGEVTDVTPERQYVVDLRRLDPEERDVVDDSLRRKEFAYPTQQERLEKRDYIKNAVRATRLASKYKQQENIKRPTIGTEVPRRPAMTNFSSFGVPFGGQTLPSMGEAPGSAGSVNYANKPQPRTGKPYNTVDFFG